MLIIIYCEINIHVIPHSHQDVGWIKTPQVYYKYKVSTIYTNVFNNISGDRTFVIAEIYFFKQWYDSIKDDLKQKVKELIKNKKIEFELGGWVMHDQATPNYQNIIDQVRLGNQWIKEEFGVEVKNDWGLDPFGFGAGSAEILRLLNYDNVYINGFRIDRAFHKQLKYEQNYEFYWRPFEDSNDTNKEIFTHISGFHYGFKLFAQCLAEFLSDYSLCFSQILNDIYEHSKGYKHKEFLFLFGEDFYFQDAREDFKLIDQFINYTNTYVYKDETFNAFFSLPSIYIEEVKSLVPRKEFKTFSNFDLYPYICDWDDIWTGYFTSKPYLKGTIKKASNALYAYNSFFTFLNFFKNKFIYLNYDAFSKLISPEIIKSSEDLRRAIALTQHHDAITGTARHDVVQEYIRQLNSSLYDLEQNFTNEFQKVLGVKINKVCFNNEIVEHQQCAEYFTLSENDTELVLGIYNPTTYKGKNLITIEILNSDFKYEIQGIESHFFCANHENISNYSYEIKCFLSFFYNFEDNKPFVSLIIEKTNKKINKLIPLFKPDVDDIITLIEDEGMINNFKCIIENDSYFELNYRIKNNKNKEEAINQIYFSFYDANYKGTYDDGVYVFSTETKHPEKFNILNNETFYMKSNIGLTIISKNDVQVFTIFTLFYDPLFAMVDHIFNKLEYMEYIDPYNRTAYKASDKQWQKNNSTNYAFVFDTNLNNTSVNESSTFYYTDSNNMRMMERISNFHKYYKKVNKNIPANFYPVTSAISIKDSNNTNNAVTIFTDRSQSGSGALKGKLILLLNRVSRHDDGKGLAQSNYEYLSNFKYFRTKHFIVFGNLPSGKESLDVNNFNYQFLDNYMNSGLLMFRFNRNNLNEFNFLGEFIHDKIIKEIKKTDNIKSYYQIVNSQLIIGEYYHIYDDYFYWLNKDEEGKLFLDFKDNKSVLIKYDQKGIDYKVENTLSKEDIQNLIEPSNLKFEIHKNEFLFIYFYLLY